MTDLLTRDDIEGKAITPARIREMWKAGMDDTREQRRMYWIAHEFLRGNQWLVWDSSIERLSPIPDDGIVRHTNNRLGPATRTIMAKLHRRPLTWEVPLTATDDGSIQGAKLAEAILSHTSREQDWERVRRKANRLAWKGGTGLICQEWDTEAAGVLGVDPATGKEIGKGDISLSALSITEACTEPGTEDIEFAPWWIKCVALPPKTIQRLYGLSNPPEANATDASVYDVRSPWGRDGLRSRLASVLTLFERPSKKIPEGRVVTVCGDETIHEGPWPYPFKDRLNVVAVCETEQEGRWNGDSVLWDAIPLQAELNRAHTNISEHLQKVGFAQRMAPQGSDLGDFDNDPATIIEYALVPGGGQPGYLSPPQMPAWVIQRPTDLYRAIDDVLGVHDISRGQAPPGVEAGVALNLLADQDDTPTGGLAHVSGDAWGRTGRNVLEMYAAFVKEGDQRTAMVRQVGASPEIVQWDGRMLASQTMAEVPADAIAPRSRSAHLQLALNLWDRHVFVGPDGTPDPQAFLAFADLPGIDDASEVIDADADKARRENAEMFAGQVCLPVDFDNHAVHIREHNRARKKPRFERLDPEQQSVFADHLMAHQQLAAAEMAIQTRLSAGAPHLAVAAQAHEPPLAGEAQTLANLQPQPEGDATQRGPNVGGADAPMHPDMPEMPGPQGP